ncbi:hypothetical protein JGI3_02395 [Candidatus Kryptobacter tengchongensis]|nr:hypothetical protein JGI3_02395 [Candidatus Kryptobacter tengchongensis]
MHNRQKYHIWREAALFFLWAILTIGSAISSVKIQMNPRNESIKTLGKIPEKGSPGPLQQKKVVSEAELKAEVPELIQYHKVIYKLWHIFWPNKDIGGIVQSFEDIRRGANNIKNAKLPGILRDKKKLWDENVERLIGIVNEMSEAIDSGDSVLILKKTEELHSQYEKLVRIVKPVIKELEEFHQILYVLYHYYVPEYNVKKIKETAPELRNKAEKLKEERLLEKIKSSARDEFKVRVNKLYDEVLSFVELVEGNFDAKSVKRKIEKVHSSYQAVEKLFD